MQKLAIIGASDLGKLIAHHVIVTNSFLFAGFYDNNINEAEFGEYLGKTDNLESDFSSGVFDCIIIGIGYTNFFYRKHFFDVCNKLNIPLAVFVHPSSFVDKTVKLGNGTVILPGCVLDRNVELEDNVFLNVSCTIAHDSKIGKHSFLSPAVSIAGYVTVGEQGFVGIGSIIINGLDIAAGSVIGAGAVVVKHIAEKGIYIGNPARLQNKSTT